MLRPLAPPRYNLLPSERPGRLVLFVDGVPRASGAEGVMRILVKRLQAADTALLRHGIAPERDFPDGSQQRRMQGSEGS